MADVKERELSNAEKVSIIAVGLGLTRTQAAVTARLFDARYPLHPERLFLAVWGQEREEVEITNLGVMIHRIRRKLGPSFILNKYGIGFFLSEQGRRTVSVATGLKAFASPQATERGE